MSSYEPSIPLEALLAHEGFMTGLARRLVGNDQDAADLVQEAWVATLEGPAPSKGNLRSWLRAVLLNRWRNRVRHDEVRRGHERHAAQDEAQTGEDPLVGLEQRRRVLEAVRSLPEPYLTTIFLRYYEEHSIATVAARTGVPLETARSRIQRGIELLRSKLDSEFGSRASWMVVVGAWSRPSHGPPASPSVEALGTGTTAMGGWGALALVGACAAVAILAATRFLAEAPPAGGELVPLVTEAIPRAPAPASAPDPERSAPEDLQPEATAASAGSAPSREAQPDALAASAEPNHRSVPYRIVGRVLAPNQLPIEGARIYCGIEFATSDDEGRFEFDLLAISMRSSAGVMIAPVPLVAAVEGYVAAVVPDFHRLLFEADPSVPYSLDLVLPGLAWVLSGQVLLADGRPAAGWMISLRNPSMGTHVGQERIPLETLASGQPVMQEVDAQGRFRLAGLLERPYDILAWHPDSLLHVALDDVLPTAEEIVLTAPDPADTRRVAGRLTSVSGEPLPNLAVRGLLTVSTDISPLMPVHEVRGRLARMEETGHFELQDEAQGSLKLCVDSDEFLVRQVATPPLAGLADWESVPLVVPLKCEIVLDGRSDRPPAPMLAFLDEQGNRLTVRISEEERELMGGLMHWRAATLWTKPARRTVYVSQNARTALFYDHDGTEIERRPIHPSPTAPTVLEW